MRRSDTQPGFTLPAVLVVVAALLILAVGILLVTGVERDTARSFVDRQRAELATRAGLEDFRGILATEAANDDYLVIQSTLALPSTSNAPHLFIARGKPDTDPFQFRYIPLFSAVKAPDESDLKAPKIDDEITGGANEYINFSTLPHQDAVRAAWLPVLDENGRVVARYAYWVEDLQSRVDPGIAGNDKNKTTSTAAPHARSKWPFPAPGLNSLPDSATEPDLNQIATFALDPAATDADQKSLGKDLITNRNMLVSPDSLLAAAGFQPPLLRQPGGELDDDIASAVERGLVSGIKSYQEQPLVPFAAGIDASAAGKPKLNLNKLLATGGEAAVDDMADFINEALPDYDDRKGGFPDDYVKTLAANALDYADTDKDPTHKDGEYRGIDAYPLVSEYLFKILWNKKRTQGGRIYIDLSCTVYVELWNMTNVTVEGDAEITYETNYALNYDTPTPLSLGNLANAAHNLTDGGGYKWFPKFNVNDLKPNEYRLYNCGTVNYSFDMAADTEAIPGLNEVTNDQTLKGELSASPRSGYRMRWNGKLVDQSRGGVRRPNMTLNFGSAPVPGDQEINVHNNRQQVRPSISGHFGGSGGPGAMPNMGDARMAYYLLSEQTNYGYPEGYSPNRRNIRMNLYTLANNRAIGRVLPSEWPDGGHDSPFGVDGFHGLFGMTIDDFSVADYIDPMDALFLTQSERPVLTDGDKKAPTRLSNSGRFYSVTELGRVYDPVMWQTLGGNDPYLEPGQTWGSISNSTSSANHGGGNTLRIGRPEHPQFDVPKLRASHLLDLFHTGISRSADADAALREGPLVKINGHVNINTASKPALRQLLAGSLGQDLVMRRFADATHEAGISKFPKVEEIPAADVPDVTAIADRVADAIIRSRPFASTGELANTRESNGTRVFGNQDLFPGFSSTGFPKLQWTDSAAEETFARAFDASTVRSRNFRIWVIGQSLAPSASVSASPKVLAEIRKNFTVFADPGAERKTDNKPDPAKFRLKILHESDF